MALAKGNPFQLSAVANLSRLYTIFFFLAIWQRNKDEFDVN